MSIVQILPPRPTTSTSALPGRLALRPWSAYERAQQANPQPAPGTRRRARLKLQYQRASTPTWAHTPGGRTVVTTLFAKGDEALEDIARFVGHARPATTGGSVKRLGRRPQAGAQRTAATLDGEDRADDEETPERVRNHSGELGSNAGSNRPTA